MENHPQLVPSHSEVLPAAPHLDYGYPADSGEEPEARGLIAYWRILRRRKGTVLLIAFLGLLCGVLLTLPQTPIYQAHTSIEIVGINDNFLNIKQVNPVTETGTTSETTDIQTQVRILQSDSLLERALNKLKAEPLPDAGGSTRIAAWRKALNLPEPPEDAAEAAARRVFQGVKVRAAGQTRIIEITADSTNPRYAADFANTLASEFIEQNLEARWKTTEHTSEWLTRQLDDMRIKLERSEDNLQAYARQSGLMFTMERTSVSEQKLGQLQESVSAAQTDRIARQSRYEMAMASPPDSLPDVLGDSSLREYQSKITDLHRQIAELLPTYTNEHTRVKRVQAQLATVEAAFEHERADVLKRISNEYQEAKRKEALVTGVYQAQARQVTGEAEKSIKYNILKREVDSNRQLYDTMLGQLKQSTIAAAMRASNVRVVDPAKIPRRAYKPDVFVNSVLGLLAGIGLGVGLVIMRERADRSIRQPGDTSFYLNLPELGIIPSWTGDSPARQLARLGGMMRDRSNGATERNGNGNGHGVSDGGVELVSWQRKPSPVAESFRSLLISILFSGRNGSRPKVLVFTSAGPAEGKSTIVSNLGIAIAEVGQKVLLVDADLRKPRLQTIFNVSNDPGLSDLLKYRNTADGNGAMEGLIRETMVPGLCVLTSGPAAASSTHLLYGPHMAELLKQLRKEFDTILIDTPPMLQIPDARVMGRLGDKVVLVVRAGKTSRDAVLAATQRFAEDGTKILGTILNDWNPRSSPDGYYGYRNGYYGYSNYYSAEAAGSKRPI